MSPAVCAQLWSACEADGTTVDALTREVAIVLLSYNDRNGSYTDEDSVAEGMPPLTATEARQLIRTVLRECTG